MATEREKTLYDLRQQTLAEVRRIVDDARAAGRDTLDASEEERYDKGMADWSRYDEALKKEQELSAREAAALEQRDLFVPAQTTIAQPKGLSLDEWLVRAVTDPSKSKWATVVELQKAQYDGLAPEVRAAVGVREFRTDYPLTTTDSSTTYSSYAVPTLVAPMIEDLTYAYSAVLRMGANIVTTEGINAMYIPKVATAATINLTAENAAPSNSSYPVLGRTTLNGYRCDAFAVITEEDIASSSVDMMAFLNQALSGALAAKVASYLAVGTGSSPPAGIFVAATTGKTAAAATTFTGNEVIEAYQSVSAQYRPGLKAVISQAGESLLSRLTDDNGMYIWRQGLAAGNPDTLCGVPLGTDPQGPALTTGLKPLVFYNPTNFHVRNCMNGRVFYDVSTEAQFTQFNRVIRIAKWIDCDAGDAGGCKSLTLA